MSNDEAIRGPSFRSRLLGLIGGLTIPIIFSSLCWIFPSIAGFLITPFLFIPDRLGLVAKVSSQDVAVLTVPSAHEFEIPQTGEYFIFSPKQLPPPIGILVRSKETDVPIEISYAPNILDPYSASVVPGSPMYGFYARQAGTYEIYMRDLASDVEPEYTLSIVPNLSTKNMPVLAVSFLLHIGIIALAAVQIYRWRNKDRLQQESLAKDEKRRKLDEWMKEQKR